MKNTIRILSLVLCLAMLAGVFAASAFAAEETVVLEEDFSNQPVQSSENWAEFHTEGFSWVEGTPANPENQHVKLTHENEEDGKRVLLGYMFAEDNRECVFAYNKIAAKDLTFDAKVVDSEMKIEFYIMWDLTKSDGSADLVTRRVTIDVKGDKIYNGTTEVGTISSAVDVSEWHTWTVRCSRQSGYSGAYDVQVMIDGINYVTGEFTMTTQGSPAQERFAIHARTPGSIEIDNVKMEELYLDERMGTVTSGSVNTVWQTGFGALGTELTYSDAEAGESQFTAGKFAYPNAHESTSLTLVEDAASGADEGGYLKVSLPSTASRDTYYANRKMSALLPVGETFWIQMDVKLDGDEFGFQVGTAMNDNGNASGRQLYVSIRPDGLYYNPGSGMVKADFAMPDLTEWTKLIFKCDPQAQKVTVYAGSTDLGEIAFRNLNYSETGSNFTQFKICASKLDANGAAYVDNIKVSYGVEPSVTGDASIIMAAAMLLPVSGIGLGALCLKRKKEN